MIHWELVSKSVNGYTGNQLDRTPVPGGWLIRSSAWDYEYSETSALSEGLTFMPDPGHGWEIEGVKE